MIYDAISVAFMLNQPMIFVACGVSNTTEGFPKNSISLTRDRRVIVSPSLTLDSPSLDLSSC